MGSLWRARLLLCDVSAVLVCGAESVAGSRALAALGVDSVFVKRGYSQHGVVGDARVFWPRSVSVLCRGAAGLLPDSAEGPDSRGSGDVGVEFACVSGSGCRDCGD